MGHIFRLCLFYQALLFFLSCQVSSFIIKFIHVTKFYAFLGIACPGVLEGLVLPSWPGQAGPGSGPGGTKTNLHLLSGKRDFIKVKTNNTTKLK